MLGLHLLDFATLAIYLIGIMIAGLWVARKIKNTGDYFMGGRSFGKNIYDHARLWHRHPHRSGRHRSGRLLQIGHGGNMVSMALFIRPPPSTGSSRQYGEGYAISPSQTSLKDRFSNSLGYFYALYGLPLLCHTKSASCLLGTGKTASAMTGGAISPEIAIGVMTVLFLSYGLLGGLPAAIITDFIQGIFIIVPLVSPRPLCHRRRRRLHRPSPASAH